MATSGRYQDRHLQLRDHILTLKQEAESMNCMSEEALRSQSLPQWHITSRVAAFPDPPQTASPSGDQGFKCSGLGGIFLIQTTAIPILGKKKEETAILSQMRSIPFSSKTIGRKKSKITHSLTLNKFNVILWLRWQLQTSGALVISANDFEALTVPLEGC